MKKLFFATCIALLAPAAHAGLIGTTVNSVLTTQAAGGWDSNTAVVGAGVEFNRNFSGPNWALTLNVADTSFTLRYINSFADTGQGAFNAGLLSFNLTNLANITNVVLANSTFGSGLGTATFTSTSINVPITTLIPPGGTDWSATWNITFAGSSTPEPSSGLLALAGFGVVAWRFRSRRNFR